MTKNARFDVDKNQATKSPLRLILLIFLPLPQNYSRVPTYAYTVYIPADNEGKMENLNSCRSKKCAKTRSNKAVFAN